jgi:Uma2 family endonuclease
MRAIIAEMPTRWLEERWNSEAGQWDEVWDGVLHMPPAPNIMHQRLEGQLYAYLLAYWGRPRRWRVYYQINLTHPDTPDWTKNYRIPDLVLLDPPRFGIERGSHMAGAPLAVVEIRSPGDETDDKFPFYAALGVPEVWAVHRDGSRPEVWTLTGDVYQLVSADADGWLIGPATGVRLQHAGGKLRVQVGDDSATLADLPDD